ncbi:MAG: APC family permease [Psychrilyobacter sp.]|uniref:APC family permease n=1 Tax=Psychrilyobacter sp. TaxID=2586924 RepID=UPI003C789166
MENNLKKSMSFSKLLIYALIFMVPIAPFGIYGQIFNVSHGMVSLVYLIGFVGMLFTAISYGRMMQQFKKAGSIYEYAKQGLGETIGFFGGWVVLLDYFVIPSLLYIVASFAMNQLLPSVSVMTWAIIFIIFNSFIAFLGLNYTDILNKIFLIGMLILIGTFAYFAIKGISNHSFGNGFTIAPFYKKDSFSIQMVFSAVSIAVMSFLGFDGVSTLSEEANEGTKYWYVPVVSLLVVVILFLIQVTLAAWAVPSDIIFKNNLDNAWYIVAKVVGGPLFSSICAIATALSWGVTNALAAQTAVSRVLFSMGRDKMLPKILSKLHPKYQTPYIAIIFSSVVSLILVYLFKNHLGMFIQFLNFGALTGFLLLHVSVLSYFIFKKRELLNIFTDIISPILGFIILGYIWISLDALAKELGGIWLIIGIIVFFLNKYKGVKNNLSEEMI